MKYCSSCAHEVVRKIPEGEDRERDVCPSCGEIFYVNPKIIVGCIPMIGDQVLLCKRAIEPRYGKWTLPAGFMENRETTAEGAAREMREEAEARAVDMALYRIFDVPHISQVYVFYRCEVLDGQFGAGEREPRSKPLLADRAHFLTSRSSSSYPSVQALTAQFLRPLESAKRT